LTEDDKNANQLDASGVQSISKANYSTQHPKAVFACFGNQFKNRQGFPGGVRSGHPTTTTTTSNDPITHVIMGMDMVQVQTAKSQTRQQYR